MHRSSAKNMKIGCRLTLLVLLPLLAACEQLGLETPAVEQAREEAEGKAIGSGCRQTGRALEDCYQINRRAPKAAIFAGWREMDGYMRENKIEEIKPDFPMKPPPGPSRPLEGAEEPPAEKPPAKEAADKAEKAAEAKAAEPAARRPSKSPLSR